MKVGFITEHYPPTEGGVATSTRRIARELVKLGVEVFVFTFDSSRPLDSLDYTLYEEDNGVKIYRFGPFFTKRKKSGKKIHEISEKEKATLRRKVFNQMSNKGRELGINIILSFYLLNAGFIAQYVANELKIPCVAGVRGNDIGRNIFNVQRFAVIEWVIRNASRIVCVNHHLYNRTLLAFPYVKDKLSVIKNGIKVDTSVKVNKELRKELVKKMGWDENDLVVTFSGNLREKKGAVQLIYALNEVNQKGEQKVRFLQIGPPISQELVKSSENLWDKLLSENIIYYTGTIPREEVSRWMISTDVVLMPSIDDGMSNGLLEGMAVGLCPLATDIFTDVVEHGENGVIVKAGSINHLVDAFLYLLQNRQEVARMGENAREYVMKYHRPEDEALSYYQLFKNLLNMG